MPRLTPEEIEALLSRTQLVRMATVAEDGSPLVVPLAYLYRDREILLTARERDGWLAHIRHDPRVCLSIDESRYPMAKITVRGRARVTFEPGQDDEWRDRRLPLAGPSTVAASSEGEGESEEWSYDAAYRLMTHDESRALVTIALDESTVTSWRMPIEGELLDESWPARYYRAPPRRFRVTKSGPRLSDVRVVAE